MEAPLPPVQIQECLAIIIDWTHTIGHIPCQIQPEPAHDPWSPSSSQKAQGSMRYCWRVAYFSLISGLFNRTLSHMCDSWCLPMVLIRDGSLTFINIASFL